MKQNRGIRDLCKLVQQWEQDLYKLKSESHNINPGKISRCGMQFYERHGESRRGISKDPVRIKELMRLTYLNAAETDLETSILCIKNTIKNLQKRKNIDTYIHRRFDNCKYDIYNVTWSKFQKKAIGFQSMNPYRKEELKLTTNGGTKVRSFAEQTIGNLLEELNIPYLYEPRLKVNVTGMNDIKGAFYDNERWFKYYYPDFVLLMWDSSIFIHEHLGRIDDKEYRISNSEKLIAYTSSGYIDTDRLILTYQEDVYDTTRLRRLLEDRVLSMVS